MAIPKEILAVARPSSTVVKQRGTRFVVIKRTSKRVGKRVVPVDLGTVGEIIDGRFVERKKVVPRQKTIDIKDYGEVALCNKHGKDLLDELAKFWKKYRTDATVSPMTRFITGTAILNFISS